MAVIPSQAIVLSKWQIRREHSEVYNDERCSVVACRRPEEMGFSEDMKIRVVEMIEGSECAPFWLVLGSSSRALYHSLVGGP